MYDGNHRGPQVVTWLNPYFICKSGVITQRLIMNYQGIYDFHDCDACGIEDESQKHILECPTLISLNEENEEMPEYEKIFEGSIQEQLDIARVFQKNMEIKDSLIIK